jgi:hypothetical protein
MIAWSFRKQFFHTGNHLRQRLVPTVWALALSLGLAGLAGCGSSSTPPPPPPSITSFVANPTAIEAGSSATLTAVFVNGTGMVTPGNVAVTSGMPITVSPTATTTYTLTVTPTSGDAVTTTAAITVSPAPVITSFVAAPATIEAGTSSSLTAVFTGGTGVISPGAITVTSGTAVPVSPTTTTTYTLTVTPVVGAAATQTVSVTVDPAPAITSFVANPTTITAGASSSLTAVFSGGTGMIMPGGLAVTSGTAVPVSPTVTSTYTLTVTPLIGVAITSSPVMVTVTPATPVITSFVANPTTITAGSSSSLTAVFTGGTGVITPGNLPVTSGTAVSVSPTTTTPYTLTVTPTTGTAITQTVTVTVDAAPVITSFVASPNSITAGQTTILTGLFQNGTGVITPGNLSATSGTPVSVSPTTTTTYTLTVTSTAESSVSATATATVTVAAVAPSAVTVNTTPTTLAVTDQLLGMNLAAWYDVTSTTDEPAIQQGFATAGIKALRWPGGSWSDEYNWETNTECGNYANTNDDFTDVVNKLVMPTGVDLALTADYGTGKNCTGPGDPTEAAAWATEALNLGVTVSHMTVGNEEYGSWEFDNHTLKNNPATYAAAVVGSNGYYQLIKTASPNTLVGVDVDEDNSNSGWDKTVLSNAKGFYDFVEYHYYPETPGQESDSFIVHQAAQELTSNINTVKSELTKWGTPGTPIYVGEIGGPYSNPGKQSWSITQGLYAGQVLGEMMNDGVSRLTWWIGFGNCNGQSGNDASSLYGWQDFGAYNVFSDGPSDSSCPNAGPAGTLSPTARAFELFSQVAVNGEFVLTSTVSGDTTDVRAYAATNSGGTALVVFNLNETVSEPITITLTGKTSATSITQTTYDKSLYDESGLSGNSANPLGTDTWAPPTTTTLGAQSLPLSITLTPWSMNVFIIK